MAASVPITNMRAMRIDVSPFYFPAGDVNRSMCSRYERCVTFVGFWQVIRSITIRGDRRSTANSSCRRRAGRQHRIDPAEQARSNLAAIGLVEHLVPAARIEIVVDAA